MSLDMLLQLMSQLAILGTRLFTENRNATPDEMAVLLADFQKSDTAIGADIARREHSTPP